MIRMILDFKLKDTPENREAVEEGLSEAMDNCPWGYSSTIETSPDEPEPEEPENPVAKKIRRILPNIFEADKFNFDVRCEKISDGGLRSSRIRGNGDLDLDAFHIAVIHVMQEDGEVVVWLNDNLADARELYQTLDEEGSMRDHDELLVLDLKAMKVLNVKKTYALV
jgi:hypothetical protein